MCRQIVFVIFTVIIIDPVNSVGEEKAGTDNAEMVANTENENPSPPQGSRDPVKDAEELNAALIKDGQDREKIKEILVQSTCEHRKQIQIEYDKKYELNLEGTIAKYTKSTYETLLKCCFFCDGELLALFLYKSYENRNWDATLRTVYMAGLTEDIKKNYLTAYESRYHSSVIEFIVNKYGESWARFSREILSRKRLTAEDACARKPEEVASALVDEESTWESRKTAQLEEFLITTPLDVVPKVVESFKTMGSKEDLLDILWKKSKYNYFNFAHIVINPDDYYACVCNDNLRDSPEMEVLILIGLFQSERNISGIVKKYSERYKGQNLIDDLKKMSADDAFKDLLIAFYSIEGK